MERSAYYRLMISRIISLCEKQGITRHRLSLFSGIDRHTLSHLLSGKTKRPRIDTLHRIANGFGMTLAEFLDFPELNEYSFDEEGES